MAKTIADAAERLYAAHRASGITQMVEWVFRRTGTIACRLLLGISIAASLVAGPSATAQDQHTGTLVPGRAGSSMVEESGRLRASDRPQNTSNAATIRMANEAQETLRRYAGCLVAGAGTQREQRDLAMFLRTAPNDPALKARSDKIMRENCLYGTGGDSVLLRFDSVLLRGAIFRELYLDYGKRLPAPVSRDDVEVAPGFLDRVLSYSRPDGLVRE